ncbi:hypothetical protein V6N11_081959 [Hibiscus sabdariffa]|uniref:Uncharacterized protein n=1 Tax=Hibiscus sabdariffa TaxID=183260 RepID=A0ABR2Q826_9ROSI
MLLLVQDLPSHLILEILTSGKRLTAADLVSLELTSRTFGGNHGVYPTKFRSLVDLAAFQLCTTNGIYIGMSCSNQREWSNRRTWSKPLQAILCGVLGHGPETTQCVAFTRINFPSPANVIQMSASQNHAAFVLQSGEVFTCGDNSSFCCGHRDPNPIFILFLSSAFFNPVFLFK